MIVIADIDGGHRLEAPSRRETPIDRIQIGTIQHFGANLVGQITINIFGEAGDIPIRGVSASGENFVLIVQGVNMSSDAKLV